MSLSDGQTHALEQLRAVEAEAGGLLTLVAVKDPAKAGEALLVKLTIDCGGMERAQGGLPLEGREEFIVAIATNFPFAVPSVFVTHERFAGFPHVQWKHSLCLYQAPATEWNPSDGMFGFLARLNFWLVQGALSQLDPVGAPLHPPVAYLAEGPVRTVIPRADTPEVGAEPWFGTAHLRSRSDVRIDLVGWSPVLDGGTPEGVAAAVLLPTPFPYEFPTKVRDLVAALDERGVSREGLFLTLQWAVLHNPKGAPLFVVVGTPMRGTRGGQLRQHLSVWYVAPAFAWALKAALKKYDGDVDARTFGEEVEKLVLEWAEVAEVEWCDVREDRPEIVTRRDRGSPLSWFAGRAVAVWGCGALGGHVAEYLARAGVGRLILHDKGVVTPGILVRQPFDDADIGETKAAALADRLRRIRPDLPVEVTTSDILEGPLAAKDWAGAAEVVIDAAASTSVLGLLETRRRESAPSSAVPVISMAIGHEALRGMVTVSLPDHTGGPLDTIRRLKLEACRDVRLTAFLDEFWPPEPRPFFQPEPGCSDATFVGSAADVSGLAAMMLNLAAKDLARRSSGATATGHFVAQPAAVEPGGSPLASFSWRPDRVSQDVHIGYEVRISPSAWSAMRSWIDRSRAERGRKVETGGLLFGERDDGAGVIWVTEVSGPPADSMASASKFICGVEGTAAANAENQARSRGSVHYVGMWHTHPDSMPIPSARDWVAMRRLVEIAGGASRVLMLIVGGAYDGPVLGTYVFRAADFKLKRKSVTVRPCVLRVMQWSDSAGGAVPPDSHDPLPSPGAASPNGTRI